MEILLTLLSSSPYLDFPQGLAGWLGWLFLLGITLLLQLRWRRLNAHHGRTGWAMLVILLFSAVPASLFVGMRLPLSGSTPLPGMPVEIQGPAALIFSALPWMLAAGIYGPAPAALVGVTTGLLRAVWETHSLFTPLELALLATLFAALARQPYRTAWFRFLRRPLPASALTLLGYLPLYLFTNILSIRGELVASIDYALSHLSGSFLAMAIELFVAATFVEVLVFARPSIWGAQVRREPSPVERSLLNRFLFTMAPLALGLVLMLMVGDWMVAGSAAKDLLQARMEDTGRMAADSIPFFFESGQNLVLQLAEDERLYTATGTDLGDILEEDLRRVPYFRQLYVLDATGASRGGYPAQSYDKSQAPMEEQRGIELALAGLPFQTYTIPPAPREAAAQVSFIAAIQDEGGDVRGVLVGRTDLESNPFTQPLLVSLRNMAGADGESFLLDEYNRILYHSDPEMVMTEYDAPRVTSASFFEGTASDASRQFVYVQPATGQPWAVVITVPTSRSQQLALDIAAPLLGALLIATVLGFFLLRVGLGGVTRSLYAFTQEAERISQGGLDHPLQSRSDDEVGRLSEAFEQMRISLKARLDELNRLLLVSQGVASSLEIGEAVQPILDSAMSTGASAARIVLNPELMPTWHGDSPVSLNYGLGPSWSSFNVLDGQALKMAQKQERVSLENLSRSRVFKLPQGALRPDSLFAVPLRHENLYYGVLYVVYDKPHKFSEEQQRFLVTLAGQAALAAANTRLFLNAEIGRQRLAAILASTPDPVLVTDQNDCLLLANPAAWHALDLGVQTNEGHPIDGIIQQPELLQLLHSATIDKQSAEINLSNGRVYLATASSVLAEGQRVGRVCVLRDVTHFKELDAMKSEFVSTVSHDLRSPLTLIRGYATMLEMVGDLNEQQKGYVRKIVTGVESMTRLVTNLLDLGRIEAGVDLQVEMVPIIDIVERVVGALQIQATQKRIHLSTKFPADIEPLIEADPALLQQALQNLVENAIKYTRSEGKVEVRLRNHADTTIFEVADTGIGISPMDQPRLFEKFYRSSQPGPKDTRGTGLGLAIVRSIVERHGGRVWLESHLGKGTTFYMAIPMRQPGRQQVIVEPRIPKV